MLNLTGRFAEPTDAYKTTYPQTMAKTPAPPMEAPTPEEYGNFAQYASCFYALIGLVFMLNCRKVPMKFVTENKAMQGVNLANDDVKRMYGFACHVFFILGCMTFAFGITNVCLCSSLFGETLAAEGNLALAVTPGIGSVFGMVAFMMVRGFGITGVPGLNGPPLPAKIILCIVKLTIVANAIVQLEAGGSMHPALGVDGVPGGVNPVLRDFAAMYLVAVLVPQLIAAKHRKKSWMEYEAIGDGDIANAGYGGAPQFQPLTKY